MNPYGESMKADFQVSDFSAGVNPELQLFFWFGGGSF